MAQTFDIRFARSAGLAAMLEVPENAFRWKGGGLLRIDAHGISIGLKRGLLALLGGKHTQRIPTEDLRAVYREGDALRVEFQTGESARVVLPFWADDRDTAAQIVSLLPTTETVEIEHATRSGTPRADWRMLLSLGIALAAILGGSWAVYQRTIPAPVAAPVPASDPVSVDEPAPLPMPDASESLSDRPASPASQAAPPVDAPSEPALPDFLEPPSVVLPVLPPLPLPADYVRSEDFVVPIARGTKAYDIARRELALFQQETFGLEAGYRTLRNLLNGGTVTPEIFAEQLGNLEMKWWDLTFRIFENDALADPALLDLRATMLGAARLWRGFLTSYADGMRKRDHVMIANSFDELARAQEMQSRARLFVR